MHPFNICESIAVSAWTIVINGATLEGSGVWCTIVAPAMLFCRGLQPCEVSQTQFKLSVTDVLARTLRKGAAKCERHCDVRNSGNEITI